MMLRWRLSASLLTVISTFQPVSAQHALRVKSASRVSTAGVVCVCKRRMLVYAVSATFYKACNCALINCLSGRQHGHFSRNNFLLTFNVTSRRGEQQVRLTFTSVTSRCAHQRSILYRAGCPMCSHADLSKLAARDESEVRENCHRWANIYTHAGSELEQALGNSCAHVGIPPVTV